MEASCWLDVLTMMVMRETPLFPRWRKVGNHILGFDLRVFPATTIGSSSKHLQHLLG